MQRLPCLILPLVLSLSLLLTGCGALLRTEYQPPETTTPEQWTATGNATTDNVTTASLADWPTDFGDPELTRLVELALKRNNDLAAAAIKVRKAQLQAGLAFDDLLPDLSATVKSDHSLNLAKGGTSLATKEGYYDWTNSYSASLGVSYEADLWGRLARAHDSAEWEALATEQDRQSTALSLVGTTMNLYWEIAYDNVRLELSRSNTESAEQTLELMEAQELYGAVSALEVNQARQDLANLRSSHQTLEQARTEDVNALAVLFDMPPGQVMADPQDLSLATLPAIPAGLPCELLARRPDLRAAELRLREYLADTDEARAGFYPTISLTGSLGGTSDQLAYLLENPVLALASSLAFPFLNWNNLSLNLKVSQAEYEQAVVEFRQTLYEAMVEVENALSNRGRLAEQAKHLDDNLEAAREVARIYEVRYRSGSGTLKDWLDAQDTLRSAEESVAENRYNQLANFVTLYQALGGEPAQQASGEEATAR